MDLGTIHWESQAGRDHAACLRFEKSLETWDPGRGEDPGRGNLVRQTERQSEQVGKSHQLSSRWG